MARKPDETALPLDDPRWRPIVEVHRRMSESLGHPALAASDLIAMLVDGRVRCMRRCLLSAERQRTLRLPDRELVPPEFWAAHELIDSRRDGALVIHRATPEQRQQGRCVIILVKGFVFFVWGPDADQILQKPTTTTRRRDRPPVIEVPRRLRQQHTIKQVANDIYPQGYGDIENAQLIDVVSAELKARNIRVSSPTTILRALGRRKDRKRKARK